MTSDARHFYSTPVISHPTYTLTDVHAGRVIMLNPALITITDRLIANTPSYLLQRRVKGLVERLLQHKIRTFHADVNFPDYIANGGFGSNPPDVNTSIFTPDALALLSETMREHGAFLNLHLLTTDPLKHLDRFADTQPGAVCFQLDTAQDPGYLCDLVDAIHEMGACASPVIETVGTDKSQPAPPEYVTALLRPVLPRIGMLTFQAAYTGARSTHRHTSFAANAVRAYLAPLRDDFAGTIQVQGGMRSGAIGAAVKLGAEFLVVGTQLFNSSDGLSPEQEIDRLLAEAALATTRQPIHT